jgi:hypothetical protein
VFITAVGGSASFTGLLTTAATQDIEIFRSLPQKVVLDAQTNTRFLARIQSKDVPANVILTAFTSYTLFPRMTVKLPSSDTPVVARSTNGFAEYTPTASDVGKNAEISVYAYNRTVLTVLVRESPASSQYPVVIAQGQIQRDRITTYGLTPGALSPTLSPSKAPSLAPIAQAPSRIRSPPPSLSPTLSLSPRQTTVGQSHYYVFSVPADVTGSITFTLESLEGDCDLYVNPSTKGFYHRGETALYPNEDYPIWASQRPGSMRDSVTVRADDAFYVENGGQYFISVYSFASISETESETESVAEYTLRVRFEDSVLTLSEDMPLVEYVERETYNYYRFTDFSLSLSPSPSDTDTQRERETESLIFDVQPMSGDADMYISCRIKATGDQTGYPSALLGHYNFSSALYQEDSILIAPGKGCPALSLSSSPSLSGGDRGRTYYLGIYGYSSSMYALTVTHAQSVRTLIPGLPVKAVVYRHLSQYFRVRVSGEAEDIEILLSPD